MPTACAPGVHGSTTALFTFLLSFIAVFLRPVHENTPQPAPPLPSRKGTGRLQLHIDDNLRVGMTSRSSTPMPRASVRMATMVKAGVCEGGAGVAEIVANATHARGSNP